MLQTAIRRIVIAATCVLFLSGVALAQDEPAPKKEKAEGRLPAYYRDVVTDSQKEEIYAIQGKYEAQIADLQKQLLALVKKRNAEVAAVLTADQHKLIETLAADAKAKRDQFRASFQAAIEKAKLEAKKNKEAAAETNE